MRIAVSTPSGHIGSATVGNLLDFGGFDVVLLARRRSDKLQPFIDRGAKLVVGPTDNEAFLVQATQGVDGLLWVTPPGYGSDNLRAFQNRLGRAAAKAIRTNEIVRVVNVSSIGANVASGAGPISGLHDVENLLSDASDSITHLRPGFFFENLLWQLDSIKERGCISLPLSGSRRYPMIATRDIAQVAAERLSDRTWTGHWVQELHGPSTPSQYEVAEALSKALGRDVQYARIEPEQLRRTLIENAMAEDAVDKLIEMYEAIENGVVRPLQQRSSKTTTPTTLVQFARETLLPLLEEQQVVHGRSE